MRKIKKVLLACTVLCFMLIFGYLYFENQVLVGKSSLDEKNVEEQKQEILSNEEFKKLPEVVALEEQLKNAEKENVSKNENPLPESDSAASPVPSQKEIENKLKVKLGSLQAEYNGKLIGLIGSAKKEYQLIKSGQSNQSKTDLAKKYIGLAKGLEAQCDARVYATIAYTENELKQFGYNSNYPDQAREVYQQSKKERRKQLLSKI